MVLQRIFRLSSVLRSAVSVHLKRNIGVTAVAFNKELDPVQKLFVDKIREYKSKRQASGGPVDIGPEYQQDLDRELYKLKQMYGKVTAVPRETSLPRVGRPLALSLTPSSGLFLSGFFHVDHSVGSWGRGRRQGVVSWCSLEAPAGVPIRVLARTHLWRFRQN